MTNASNLWSSHTGIITRMKEGRGPKAEFVSFTIAIAKKDGGSFNRDAIAFREAMATVLELGVGARVYIRGPISASQKATAEGGMRKVTSMTAYEVQHKPIAAEADTAATAQETISAPAAVATPEPVAAAIDGVPAMPEGASLDTHQIYTKRDGAKAWRKRPARKVAATEAAPVEATAADAPVASAPEAPVAAIVAPVRAIDPTSISDDTAMGAALRKALMAA